MRSKWQLIAGIGLPVAIVVVVGITAGQQYLFNTHGFSGSFTKVVSGMFDINGLVPAGSTITLFERKARTTGPFIPFATGVQPQDQSAWGFIDGKTGTSYEIMATLVNNGSVIGSAGPIPVTVPAINQILTFNVDTPFISAGPTPAPIAADAAISGRVGINGYIPPGATLTLQRRKQGGQFFTIVQQNIVAQNGQSINYTQLIPGTSYEVKALLYSASQQLIGTSSVLTVSAPASNEELDINSSAVPQATPTAILSQPTTPVVTMIIPTNTPSPSPTPTPQIAIAGTIQFQGQAPINSRIVVFERISGAQSYQVAVDNISPQDGISWQWTSAITGKLYDILAILKQKQSDGTDKDISSSNTLSVAAPATSQTLSINSGFVLPAPSGNITITCNSYDSNSQTWNTAVSFANVVGALSYWYEIGTTDGGIELTNFTQNATGNSSQSSTYQFKNGTTYYARYAYAGFSNLQSNDSRFSPFSSTVQLRCSQ